MDTPSKKRRHRRNTLQAILESESPDYEVLPSDPKIQKHGMDPEIDPVFESPLDVGPLLEDQEPASEAYSSRWRNAGYDAEKDFANYQEEKRKFFWKPYENKVKARYKLRTKRKALVQETKKKNAAKKIAKFFDSLITKTYKKPKWASRSVPSLIIPGAYETEKFIEEPGYYQHHFNDAVRARLEVEHYKRLYYDALARGQPSAIDSFRNAFNYWTNVAYHPEVIELQKRRDLEEAEAKALKKHKWAEFYAAKRKRQNMEYFGDTGTQTDYAGHMRNQQFEDLMRQIWKSSKSKLNLEKFSETFFDNYYIDNKLHVHRKGG